MTPPTAPAPPHPRRVTHVPLPSPAPGTARSLTVFRYGEPGARPKAYIQAALHADELPGPLVAHHLARQLDAIDAGGGIRGEIVLVPFANPIGLAQFQLGRLSGRYEFAEGQNFNRSYAELARGVALRVGDELGDDAHANVSRIRAAMGDVLAAHEPLNALDTLRHRLLSMAFDADIVLDLHSDNDAVLHLYLGTALWPDAADLGAQLGARAVLLEAESGGNPFDEACSAPWWQLAARFPEANIPPACLSSTVELRSENQLDDALAASDADNLVRFLARRGVVDAEPGPLPERLCDATPLTGVEVIRAPRAGLVVYHRHPGDRIDVGDPIADIVDPTADDPEHARTRLTSRVRGVFVGRRLDRLATPGRRLCEIAGETPLAERTGYLSAP